MSQRQPSMTTAGGSLKPGGLAALLRQASSPGMQRPEGSAAVMHRQGGRRGSSPTVQRPEAAAVMHRQGVRDSNSRQSRPSDLQRLESSTAAMQRQGSRAGRNRGTSPALQHPGALAPPVVAADFARQESSGLALFPSGNLEGRSERVSEDLIKLSFSICSVCTCIYCCNCCLSRQCEYLTVSTAKMHVVELHLSMVGAV